MKIRTTLTLQYAGITAAVFFAFVVAVYYVSEHSRSNTFFRNLQSEAITKAHLFLNNQVDAKTMQSIYLNNQKFINEVEVAVYTTDFKILYHDALQNDIVKETPEMVKRILKRKNISFYVDEYQAIGLVYPFEGQDYIVTAAAYDGYGYANRDALRNMLILLFIGGLTVLAVVGYILSRSTLKPIRNIVREAEKITASHIDKRLPVKNEQDELGELSITFNALLERLEKSYGSPYSRTGSGPVERTNLRTISGSHQQCTARFPTDHKPDRRIAESCKSRLSVGTDYNGRGPVG